jgi:hypothetical protein
MQIHHPDADFKSAPVLGNIRDLVELVEVPSLSTADAPYLADGGESGGPRKPR